MKPQPALQGLEAGPSGAGGLPVSFTQKGGLGRCAAASPRQLSFHNHQRACALDLRCFRKIARWLLDQQFFLAGYELEASLLKDAAMARLNEQFVHHAGSTDVITFDYTMWDSARQEGASPQSANSAESSLRHPPSAILGGEIFLCPDEALRQARRFRTTWQSELVRYFIHGVLHLLGHDDLSAAPRRRMKREENRLLRAAAAQFDFAELARHPGRHTGKVTPSVEPAPCSPGGRRP